MTISLKPIASAGLAIALGAVLGTALAWHTASAVTVEDNAGNPDVSVPLADPDQDTAGSQGSSSGFSIIAPDQNGGSGLQWTFGSPGSTDDGGAWPTPPGQ